MKLTHLQLESHLNKKLAPVYLVSGEEPLLKQDTMQLIRLAAKKNGYTEQTRLIPGTTFDWDELYSQLHANSLFAEYRLLELDCRDTLPNKAAASLLQEYAAHPSSNTLLIIQLNKLDDKITRSTWYAALEKIGVGITLWPIPREQFPMWIKQRAERHSLSLTPEAIKLLTDDCEGNLTAAAQALEKLSLLNPVGPIDVNLIHTFLGDESHFTLFDFLKHYTAGKTTNMLHSLDNLRIEGVEPILVLWGITRELRRKSAASELRQAAHIDAMIKGAAQGDPWDALQLLCLR